MHDSVVVGLEHALRQERELYRREKEEFKKMFDEYKQNEAEYIETVLLNFEQSVEKMGHLHNVVIEFPNTDYEKVEQMQEILLQNRQLAESLAECEKELGRLRQENKELSCSIVCSGEHVSAAYMTEAAMIEEPWTRNAMEAADLSIRTLIETVRRLQCQLERLEEEVQKGAEHACELRRENVRLAKYADKLQIDNEELSWRNERMASRIDVDELLARIQQLEADNINLHVEQQKQHAELLEAYYNLGVARESDERNSTVVRQRVRDALQLYESKKIGELENKLVEHIDQVERFSEMIKAAHTMMLRKEDINVELRMKIYRYFNVKEDICDTIKRSVNDEFQVYITCLESKVSTLQDEVRQLERENANLQSENEYLNKCNFGLGEENKILTTNNLENEKQNSNVASNQLWLEQSADVLRRNVVSLQTQNALLEEECASLKERAAAESAQRSSELLNASLMADYYRMLYIETKFGYISKNFDEYVQRELRMADSSEKVTEVLPAVVCTDLAEREIELYDYIERHSYFREAIATQRTSGNAIQTTTALLLKFKAQNEKTEQCKGKPDCIVELRPKTITEDAAQRRSGTIVCHTGRDGRGAATHGPEADVVLAFGPLVYTAFDTQDMISAQTETDLRQLTSSPTEYQHFAGVFPHECGQDGLHTVQSANSSLDRIFEGKKEESRDTSRPLSALADEADVRGLADHYMMVENNINSGYSRKRSVTGHAAAICPAEERILAACNTGPETWVTSGTTAHEFMKLQGNIDAGHTETCAYEEDSPCHVIDTNSDSMRAEGNSATAFLLMICIIKCALHLLAGGASLHGGDSVAREDIASEHVNEYSGDGMAQDAGTVTNSRIQDSVRRPRDRHCTWSSSVRALFGGISTTIKSTVDGIFDSNVDERITALSIRLQELNLKLLVVKRHYIIQESQVQERVDLARGVSGTKDEAHMQIDSAQPLSMLIDSADDIEAMLVAETTHKLDSAEMQHRFTAKERTTTQLSELDLEIRQEMEELRMVHKIAAIGDLHQSVATETLYEENNCDATVETTELEAEPTEVHRATTCSRELAVSEQSVEALRSRCSSERPNTPVHDACTHCDNSMDVQEVTQRGRIEEEHPHATVNVEIQHDTVSKKAIEEMRAGILASVERIPGSKVASGLSERIETTFNYIAELAAQNEALYVRLATLEHEQGVSNLRLLDQRKQIERLRRVSSGNADARILDVMFGPRRPSPVDACYAANMRLRKGEYGWRR